jgi:FkbM family methyltransferase
MVSTIFSHPDPQPMHVSTRDSLAPNTLDKEVPLMPEPTIDLRVPVGDTTTSFWLPQKGTDHVQRSMWQGESFYEFQMLCHSQVFLSPGDEVIDVGAYIGNHTLFYANVCGARVFSFEPNQAAFDTMRANLDLNGLADSVTTVCAGVGAETGRASLVVPDKAGNAGMCQLELMDEGTIEIVRLDDQEGITNPKLIKIDVEGMELEVLQGAEKLIAEHHPMLYIESPIAAHFARISELLTAWGYQALAQFNATTTICFVHSTDTLRIQNEQISYFQYDLRQQLARLSKRIGASGQEVTSNVEQHFEQLAQDLSASQALQEKLASQVDSLATSQRQLERSLEDLKKEIRSIEARRIEEVRAGFRDKTARKIRKARKDPGRFIADSSGYKALSKLIGDNSDE